MLHDSEFKDGANEEVEYTYDENGNLTQDLNKNIADIQYNYLNLPQVLKFGDGTTLTYLYDADGNKLRTQYQADGKVTTTDYTGNLVYENGTPVRLNTGYGYVSLQDSMYHYYLQDHQGNNRVVADQNGTIEEVNHYYPFGGLFATNGNIQPYKYNGKELDTRKGLNWYDYGARHYDAALGKFMTSDRFAEKYSSLSPYLYGANNPVMNIDVNGDSIVVAPNANGLLDQIKSFFGFDTKYQTTVKEQLQQLKQEDPEVAEMIERLEDSEFIVIITNVVDKTKGNSATPNNQNDVTSKQGSTVQYDPYKNYLNSGSRRPARIGLVHELGHADDYSQGKGIAIDKKKFYAGDKTEIQKRENAEKHPLYMENRIRSRLGLKNRTKEEYFHGK